MVKVESEVEEAAGKKSKAEERQETEEGVSRERWVRVRWRSLLDGESEMEEANGGG